MEKDWEVHYLHVFLENLILTGAFDSYGYKRSQLREIISDYMTLAQSKAKDRLAGQGNLFDFYEPEEEKKDAKDNGLRY